ncbi:MAG: class I SAM-dependent methyltransferase [Planctomycetia bacterium]|nr:class I SAM-dependent methyltransferase [Planctomycetia bacterium]
MTLQAYLHGYSPQEQLRLVEQAAYWKETILSDLPYKPGESLLDVGCGVGAVLGVIAAAHPTLSLAAANYCRPETSRLSRSCSSRFANR